MELVNLSQVIRHCGEPVYSAANEARSREFHFANREVRSFVEKCANWSEEMDSGPMRYVEFAEEVTL